MTRKAAIAIAVHRGDGAASAKRCCIGGTARCTCWRGAPKSTSSQRSPCSWSSASDFGGSRLSMAVEIVIAVAATAVFAELLAME